MSKSLDFLDPIPDGYQIFERDLIVAGVQHIKKDALKFSKGSKQSIALEREPNNKYDSNAIKIMGISKGFLSSKRFFIGYVPKEFAKQIVSTKVMGSVKARLDRIYIGEKDFVEIRFQILGEQSKKKQYDSFFTDKPANPWQKEFYKYFKITVPKGLTFGEAESVIKKHRRKMVKQDKAKHDDWDAYEEIYDEFEDSDFREVHDLKKVNVTLLRKVVNGLIKDGHTMRSLSDDIDIVVERVIELKPEIEKS